MIMKISILNNNGLEEFLNYLLNNNGKTLSEVSHSPSYILDENLYVDALNISIETFDDDVILDNEKNKYRYFLGKYYFNELAELSDEILSGYGIWCWLTIYHWKNLANKILSIENYIPLKPSNNIPDFFNDISITSDAEYKHCIKGSYIGYQMYKDEYKYLTNNQYEVGDNQNEILGRRWLKNYPVYFEIIKYLYLDKDTQTLTKIRSKKRYIRTLFDRFQFIEYLYDLSKYDESNMEELLALLGSEFA